MERQATQKGAGRRLPEVRNPRGSDRHEHRSIGREFKVPDATVGMVEAPQHLAVARPEEHDRRPRRRRDRVVVEKHQRLGVGRSVIVAIGCEGFVPRDGADGRAIGFQRLDLDSPAAAAPGDPIAGRRERHAEHPGRASGLPHLRSIRSPPQPHRPILSHRRDEPAVGGEDDVVDLIVGLDGDGRRRRSRREDEQRAIGAADTDAPVARQADGIEVVALDGERGSGIGPVEEAFLFGAAIAFVCSYEGYVTEAGAEGVGRSTALAVVIASVCILVLDALVRSVSRIAALNGFDYEESRARRLVRELLKCELPIM